MKRLFFGLAVDPEVAGRGIGRRLIAAVEALAPGATPTLQGARRLAEARGDRFILEKIEWHGNRQPSSGQ